MYFRVVTDFRDWTNWLLYRGGIGVKGEESWEAWWEEELVFNIFRTLFEVYFLLLYILSWSLIILALGSLTPTKYW